MKKTQKSVYLLVLIFLTMNLCNSTKVIQQNSKCNVNGEINKIQECDDGDTQNKNGCSNKCKINQGWACVPKLLPNGQKISDCKKIDQCKIYEQYSLKCSICKNGFVLNSQKSICFKQIINCQIYDLTSSSDHSMCAKCVTNFALPSPQIKTFCVPEIPNCQIYQKRLGQQESISEVSDESSEENEQIGRELKWICKICKSDYFDFTDKQTQCIKKIQHCASYIKDVNGRLICSNCQDNYIYPNQLTKDLCVEIIQHCQTGADYILNEIINVWECSVCETGFTYPTPTIKNFCVLQIDSCSSYTQNSNSEWICSTCISPLVPSFNGKQCILQNCKQISNTDSSKFPICQLCNDGYTLLRSKNTCLKNIQNCQKNFFYLNSENFEQVRCSVCQIGYFLSIDSLKCSLYNPLTKCLNAYEIQVTSTTTEVYCKRCAQGYALANGKLCAKQNVQFILHCFSLYINSTTSQYLCKNCQTNFILSSNNESCTTNNNPIQNCRFQKYTDTTQSQKQCMECKNGYILSYDKKSCYQSSIVKNCGLCQKQNGQIKCCVCYSQSLTPTGECIAPTASIQNCRSYEQLLSGSSICSQCDGVRQIGITDTLCLHQTAYQQFYSPFNKYNFTINPFNFIGLACMSGYQFNTQSKTWCSRTTTNPIQFCTQLSYTPSKNTHTCTACDKEHFLLNNACYTPIQNCLQHEYNSQLTCKQCNDGYFLSADKLSCATIDNCYKFLLDNSVSPIKVTCIECQQTFTLSADGAACSP